jgi:hypothetical protein
MRAEVFESQDAPHLARADRLPSSSSDSLGERPIGPEIAKWCRGLASLGSSAGELYQLTPRRDRDACRSPRPRCVLQRGEAWRDCEPRFPLPYVPR